MFKFIFALFLVSSSSLSVTNDDEGHRKWYNWLSRFPELAPDVKSGNRVALWTALKNQSWMMFVSWEDHHRPCALTCYDGREEWGLVDRNYSAHITEEFKRWSDPSVWWNLHWTADEAAKLNARQRGDNDPYRYLTHFGPEGGARPGGCGDDQSPRFRALAQDCGDPSLPNTTFLPFQSKFPLVDQIFKDYYDEIQRRMLQFHQTGPSDATQFLAWALRPLARMFARLALLHPYPNANSRLRYFILQTELIRLGGHPVMMDQIGDIPYGESSVEGVEDSIVDAWCAWEYAFKTGQSPAKAATPAHWLSCKNPLIFLDENGKCH